ncbi:MAG: ABC transporter ATP-binding protein [Clostridia bacterium]|nr:ABC transporter ATP-binding protein [Clostridia bacterium]
MAKPILEIKNLKKSYGSHQVLRGVSYNIEPGKIVGLLGPNGCGKTSMIKSIVGLINDYEGEILVNGEKPGVNSKNDIAYLPEKNYLPAWMTPKAAINYMADFYKNFNKDKAYELLRTFDLDEKQKIKTMSKGQQEKVQLLLVMSREAKLYILDEPLGGVDPVARDFIMETIMKNHLANSTILLSTHLIYDIEGILDRVVMIKNGVLAANTDVTTIRNHNMTVEALFKEVFRYDA